MSILDEFLSSILRFLKTKDAPQLQLFLRVEPPLPEQFIKLRQELKSSWTNSNRLEQHIERLLPFNDEDRADVGGSWPGFLVFIQEYLEFWRDVDFDDLLGTHVRLTALILVSNTALSNATYGLVMLPTTIQLCRGLTKLAILLDKRPELTRKMIQVTDTENGERKTLVESTAETVTRAFTLCLSDRTPSRNGIDRDGKPEGKKIGIYSIANMVLKLLFKCRKTNLATQLFTNIGKGSPPLGLYPASQRVTYLYYLGRFHFANTHFYHAQHCLQAAYDQCHAQCINQRRSILIYLTSANLILGRFPSPEFTNRPEAEILSKFIPIANAIRKGNIVAFKHALGPESGNERWFFQHGILLQLLSRCEVLVWRSLARRVFLLTYKFPWDPESRKAPTLNISDVVVAAQYCQKLLEGWQKPTDTLSVMQSGRTHPNSMFMKPTDLAPPHMGAKQLFGTRGTIFGNEMPDLLDIEAIIASLVQQGLLHGFLSHQQGKFAILGSKQKGGPLPAGFPPVWEVLLARARTDGRAAEVPGWVQSGRDLQVGGVYNLTGVKAAGEND